MKHIFFILLISKIVACTNNGRSAEQTGEIKPGTPISSDANQQPAENWQGCYIKIIGRDTAILMLQQNGNELSGKMLYDNYEKDGSSGTIKGKEDGEIFKLFYEFNSEGMHSVTEVYFKKDSGRLLRGVGDMDVKTDTAYFISGINYSEKEAFNKVDCKLVEGKLKF